MNHTSRIRGLTATLTLLALPIMLAASCSKKLTVDPAYTTPEGQAASDARLILWTELPTVYSVFEDNPPLGPDPSDVFVENRSVQAAASGTLHGMLLDGTIANTYEILRREASGGLLPLGDFTIPPRRRWLDHKWEVFSFDDPRPSGFTPATYVGRGLISGEITEFSPVSNAAAFSGTPLADIPVRFVDANTDTMVTWDPVPGAAYYITHFYRFREATGQEQILSGQPAPLYVGSTRDFFIGITTAPGEVGFSPILNILKLGAGFDPLVLTARDSLADADYFIRVAAVSAAGEMIAFSYGDSGIAQQEGAYLRYPLGAKRVPRVRIITGAPQRLDAPAAVRFDPPSTPLGIRRR